MADRGLFQTLAGGGYAYLDLKNDVRVEARHLRREFHQLHSELDVQCGWAGARQHNGSLACADVNLSNLAARKAFAKHCEERAQTPRPNTGTGSFDWMGLIDGVCLDVITAERAGDEPIVLDDADDTPPRNFHVHGLHIPADSRSMFIAHGDSMKSLLLLYVLGTLAERGIPVLYADWEWTAARHKARKRRLFGDARLEHLHYQRCRAPLAIEAPRLRQFCDEHGIQLLGGDSVALACDGKLADDDTANRFHRAQAHLPPAIWAAHVAKSSLGPDGKGDQFGAFGSVFFTNLCRMTWTIKKQPGATEDVVTVGAFPHKQNDGDREKPVGLQFTFTAAQIEVQPVNVADVEGFAEKIPLAVRMMHALKRGPRTYAELADELDAKTDSVIKAAKRSDQFIKILSQDGIQRLGLVERRQVA